MQKISNLDSILNDYDAIFCDIWGVVHNGVEPFKSSTLALKAARAKGVKVILITNAPSPSSQIKDHLKNYIKAESGFFDDMVTSGDVAKSIMDDWSDKKCFHLGARYAEQEGAVPDYSTLVNLEDADYALCTFLAKKDEVDLDDYLPLLQQMKQKDLPFLCSNPDYFVDVGGILYYCAGALAQMYEKINGQVIYTGKPHPIIYKKAQEKLTALTNSSVEPKKILIIGDSLSTDVSGANDLGSDMLLIGDGIHAREFEQDDTQSGSIFSDNFVGFIKQKINEKNVEVKYFMAQLA